MNKRLEAPVPMVITALAPVDHSDAKEMLFYQRFNAETKRLAAVSQNDNGDWKLRFNAVTALNGLVIEGTSFPGFAKAVQKPLKELSGCIEMQISDLRSELVKATSQLISTVAEIFTIDAVPMVTALLPVLFTVAISTNRVIRGYAQSALLTAYHSCESRHLLAFLITEMKSSKFKSTKEVAIELLAIALASWSDLERRHAASSKGIEESITLGLRGQSPQLRATAGRCFWLYKRAFPAAGAKYFASLDIKERKLVAKFENLACIDIAPTEDDTAAAGVDGEGDGLDQSTIDLGVEVVEDESASVAVVTASADHFDHAANSLDAHSLSHSAAPGGHAELSLADLAAQASRSASAVKEAGSGAKTGAIASSPDGESPAAEGKQSTQHSVGDDDDDGHRNGPEHHESAPAFPHGHGHCGGGDGDDHDPHASTASAPGLPLPLPLPAATVITLSTPTSSSQPAPSSPVPALRSRALSAHSSPAARATGSTAGSAAGSLVVSDDAFDQSATDRVTGGPLAAVGTFSPVKLRSQTASHAAFFNAAVNSMMSTHATALGTGAAATGAGCAGTPTSGVTSPAISAAAPGAVGSMGATQLFPPAPATASGSGSAAQGHPDPTLPSPFRAASTAATGAAAASRAGAAAARPGSAVARTTRSSASASAAPATAATAGATAGAGGSMRATTRLSATTRSPAATATASRTPGSSSVTATTAASRSRLSVPAASATGASAAGAGAAGAASPLRRSTAAASATAAATGGPGTRPPSRRPSLGAPVSVTSRLSATGHHESPAAAAAAATAGSTRVARALAGSPARPASASAKTATHGHGTPAAAGKAPQSLLTPAATAAAAAPAVTPAVLFPDGPSERDRSAFLSQHASLAQKLASVITSLSFAEEGLPAASSTPAADASAAATAPSATAAAPVALSGGKMVAPCGVSSAFADQIAVALAGLAEDVEALRKTAVGMRDALRVQEKMHKEQDSFLDANSNF